MDAFAKDCQRFGSLKGFKFFDSYLRGREELVITVKRGVRSPQSSRGFETTLFKEEASSVHPLLRKAPPPPSPPNPGAGGVQTPVKRGPQFQMVEGGLPPASPFINELVQANENEIRFLIGAYARYNSPYVWMRSSSGAHLVATDEPLKLSTTDNWTDAHVWDITAELVNLTIFPAPPNPFAVDFVSFIGKMTYAVNDIPIKRLFPCVLCVLCARVCVN
jgi:hypothetical protein